MKSFSVFRERVNATKVERMPLKASFMGRWKMSYFLILYQEKRDKKEYIKNKEKISFSFFFIMRTDKKWHDNDFYMFSDLISIFLPILRSNIIIITPFLFNISFDLMWQYQQYINYLFIFFFFEKTTQELFRCRTYSIHIYEEKWGKIRNIRKCCKKWGIYKRSPLFLSVYMKYVCMWI